MKNLFNAMTVTYGMAEICKGKNSIEQESPRENRSGRVSMESSGPSPDRKECCAMEEARVRVEERRQKFD
jgi:hypothetical protein